MGTVKQRAPHAGTITPTPETPRRGRPAIQSGGRLFAFTLVLVAVLAVLGTGILGIYGAWLINRQPAPIAAVGDGLRDLDCPPEIDLWECLTFAHLEPQ